MNQLRRQAAPSVYLCVLGGFMPTCLCRISNKQLWTAICTYVLVIIARKKLGLTNLSLYPGLQILSISIVNKKPILRAFDDSSYFSNEHESTKQLNVWDIHLGQ
jgi:hypothetical protein